MQFFGDKYGDLVRVVQISGSPNDLDGYSMELCGGTHVRTTGRSTISHRERGSDRSGYSTNRSGGWERSEGMGPRRVCEAGRKVSDVAK
jgi:hypothetical protein